MLNKAMLMGRLTRDPELRYTQSNMPVSSFSIAVDKTFKREGEPTADFFNITAFGKQAEFTSKWFAKGQLVMIVGRIQIRNWDDKEGNKRTSVDIIAEEAHFAESKRSSENSGARQAAPAAFDLPKASSDFSDALEDDSDVPF